MALDPAPLGLIHTAALGNLGSAFNLFEEYLFLSTFCYKIALFLMLFFQNKKK
jgi:hypothetical protein